ncbi:hypothetical protein HK099_001615, partial [Clydaea vesicula]
PFSPTQLYYDPQDPNYHAYYYQQQNYFQPQIPSDYYQYPQPQIPIQRKDSQESYPNTETSSPSTPTQIANPNDKVNQNKPTNPYLQQQPVNPYLQYSQPLPYNLNIPYQNWDGTPIIPHPSIPPSHFSITSSPNSQILPPFSPNRDYNNHHYQSNNTSISPVSNASSTVDAHSNTSPHHYHNHHHHHHRQKFSNSDRSTSRNNNSDTLQQQQDFFFSPKKEKKVNNCNVYVRGLLPSVTDKQFLEICEKFGTIVTSKAILDLQTNECKGYGFVLYENEADAKAALSGIEKLGFDTSFARAEATPVLGQESFNTKLKNLQDLGSTNIYLSNLPPDMTEEQLTNLIAPKKIVSQKILKDFQGISRGVGFVRMESREDAQDVISRLGGLKLKGPNHPLQVRFADSYAQKKLKVLAQKKKRYPSDAAYKNYKHDKQNAYNDLYIEKQNEEKDKVENFVSYEENVEHEEKEISNVNETDNLKPEICLVEEGDDDDEEENLEELKNLKLFNDSSIVLENVVQDFENCKIEELEFKKLGENCVDHRDEILDSVSV